MATPTFITPSNDDLAAADGAYWDATLTAIVRPPVVEDTPVSDVMPYRMLMRVYELHVADCAQCSGESLWDQCLYGDMLSHRAADAMSRQDELAVQN